MHDYATNFAYIDGANLHSALKGAGWRLSYKRFRTWLYEKYNVDQAYIFLGYIKSNTNLYAYLERCGFTLIFKQVTYDPSGNAKGNCDSDLVLRAVQNAYEHPSQDVVIVSSDGDFASLVTFLYARVQLRTIISPNLTDKYSILLKRTGAPITYLNEHRAILEEINEKAPDADRTAEGSLS